MTWTANKTKQVKSRLLAGKIVELLNKEDVLYKNLGTRILNGKSISEFDALNIEEQEELENKILEQVKLMQ